MTQARSLPATARTINNPGYNGEVIGINGNGDGGKQSAVGNFKQRHPRRWPRHRHRRRPRLRPSCNCATSVNPNGHGRRVQGAAQSNYGAEHSKGPITIDVISKAGGRDFHGMATLYLRDYR